MSRYVRKYQRATLFNVLWFVVVVGMIGPLLGWGQARTHPAPPKTRTDNVKTTLHGVEIIDPYRWLEEQGSPETRQWIKAENEYTDALLGSWLGRERIKRRLGELMKIDSIGTPRVRKGRYFFSRRRADQDLPVIYMRQGLNGKDEALIDPHTMSPDHTISVNLLDISEDGSLLIYGIRQGGEDETTIRLFDVEKREDLPDQLAKGRYFGTSLTPEKRGFYYARHGAEGSRVYYHTIGADGARDIKIFGDGYGPGQIIFPSLSEDGRYLLITVSHGSSGRTEIYYQDVAHRGPIFPIVKGLDARSFGQVGGDDLFLQTNWQAPNGRMFRVDLKRPDRQHWREVIPTSEDVIRGFSIAGGKLFVDYLHNVVSRVEVFQPDGKHVGEIAFSTLGNVSGVSGRWQSDEAFFAFSSFHVPTTIYRYNVRTGTQTVWAQLKVPIKSDRFQIEQVWYRSKDRTKIPMFIVHAKGLKLDGTNPTLLTGYGGFNVSLTPGFSPRAALWIENRGIYAVPNLRGGGEFGEVWHRAGMLERKQNVFDDFIAAAEWLIRNKYTIPAKLAISGGSNGGLLVGAALTQRPDLFQAVVCRYPLLDMVRYHKFLVARFWVPEYGSSEDARQFKYIRAYSPYHNVRPGTRYPAVLFITGDSDTRVAPLHARKMAALLQAASGSERPVLLRYDTKSGHSGGRPLSNRIDELSEELSFLFWQLGVAPPGHSGSQTLLEGRHQLSGN